MEGSEVPDGPAKCTAKLASKAKFRRPNVHGVYLGTEQCELLSYSSSEVKAEVLILQIGSKSWAVGYDCAVGKWSYMSSGVKSVAECETRDSAFVYGLLILLRRLGPVAAGARDGTYGVTDAVRRQSRYAIEAVLAQVSEGVRRDAVERIVTGSRNE